MKTLIEYMAVGAGGIVGAVSRFWITRVSQSIFNTDFPIGTLIINVTGCLFLGWFTTVVGTRIIVSDAIRLAIAVGFVGAYTTFSTYCLDSTKLLQSGAYYQFAFNVLGSVVIGLIAVRLGMLLAGR